MTIPISNFDVSFKPEIRNDFAEWLKEMKYALDLHFLLQEILKTMPISSCYLAQFDGESFAAQ